jgi:MYXO-CTERM domain-containing protein
VPIPDAGCGCSVPSRGDTRGVWAIALGVTALLSRRRRRS